MLLLKQNYQEIFTPEAARSSTVTDWGRLTQTTLKHKAAAQGAAALPACCSLPPMLMRCVASVCVASRWTGPESRSHWKITTIQTKPIGLKTWHSLLLLLCCHISPSTRSRVWSFPQINSHENPPLSSQRDLTSARASTCKRLGAKPAPLGHG